jgi:hypothetical protein
MTIQKNAISTLVFMLFSIAAFSQKSNIFYVQFEGKNSSFSMNYDHKLGAYHDETGHYRFYGHIGIGKLSSQEIIATKFIKGKPNTNVQLNDILLNIFFNLVSNATPDVTLERRQSFDVINYYSGGKIFLGSENFNVIVGLDVRFDRVNQTIEAWEKTPEQTLNYTKVALLPSLGLHWNKGNVVAQMVLSPQKVYGIQGGTDGVLNVGLGYQF